MVATFGALNGWILLQGRVPLAAAEDGLFPQAVRQGPRQARDTGLRPRRLVGAGHRADAHELHEGPGRRLHLRDPAGHADHAGAVRVQRRGAGVPVLHGPRALRRAAPGARHRHRGARLRLLPVGDRRLRRRHHREGLHAAAGRHPGLRRRCKVVAARSRRARLPSLEARSPPATQVRRGRERTGGARSGHRPSTARRRDPSASARRSGALRRVLLHRPDLELKRLTPRNKDELLFDDVLWVQRARGRSTTPSPTRSPSAASRSCYLHDLLAADARHPATRAPTCSTRRSTAAALGPTPGRRRSASGCASSPASGSRCA